MNHLKSRDYFYVSVQLVLFVIYIFPPADRLFRMMAILKYLFLAGAISGLILLLVAMVQLNTNLTPWPSPKTRGNLVRAGLYRYVRHPIYAGILLFAFCFAFYSGSWARIGLGICLWLLFYFKSSYEEKLLVEKYPEYEEYRRMTGRFVPRKHV